MDGDDQDATGRGYDLAVGGIGGDTLMAGSGTNLLIGGADADLFVFEANPSGTTYIGDFDDGMNKIDLSALGVTCIAGVETGLNSRGAVTLDFKDLSNAAGYAELITDAYAGFTRSNFGVMEFDECPTDKVSGHMPQSGDNFLYRDFGAPASLYRAAAFALDSVYLSAA